MKILVLTNLFPPHHAGTEDFRCQAIADNLRLRGHEVRVLTSTHGMNNARRDGPVERRLLLNGAFGHPLEEDIGPLQEIETANHAALREQIAEFQPAVVHVFSLRGLSKSLIYGLHHARLPVVYDVADTWLAEDVRNDPWLRWWNHPGSNGQRTLKEWTGQRGKLDTIAPTRFMPGCDRIPELYGDDASAPEPNSISAFRFDRLYFCSQMLKQATEEAGFKVSHADVIPPGIATQNYVGDVKPADVPMERLLFAAKLNRASGLLTAVKALQLLLGRGRRASLTIYGKGDSDYIAQTRSIIAVQKLPVEFLSVSNLHRDLPALFRQHDCLLHCAEEPEPYFLTPMEAMACGLPVIGTALGGTCELFRHGDNALLFAPGDPEDLASRIEELQAQPALRCQIAENALTEMQSQCNETVMVDRIEAYLETSLQMW
ncbi:MAG: glycosyltransferase family 4 protein [Verrucomicrobia bacterium]|nr:glycosyltransferase family 4 protein [Verrucomicrobiota bacterium]